jgi:glycosyltransferase involved in cell wall biosynthesis
MRVLIITGSLPPMSCGVGDSIVMLASEVSRNGRAEVGVLTRVEAGDINAGGVEVLPVIKRWSIFEAKHFADVVRAWKPDVAHIQYPSLGYGTGLLPYFVPLILRQMGIPVVEAWHEPPSRGRYAPTLRAKVVRYLRSMRYLPNALVRDRLVEVEPDSLTRLYAPYAGLIRRKTVNLVPVASNIPRVDVKDQERGAIRAKYTRGGRRLIATFGHAYPTKGFDSLFDIANPETDTLVLIMSLDGDTQPYHRHLLSLAETGRWQSNVVVTGFLDTIDVAKLLAVSDAVVLPFRTGVAPRNGSFMAARVQGTLVVTTSTSRSGFVADENVFYAPVDDIDGMREAVAKLAGNQPNLGPEKVIGWPDIADMHFDLYQRYLAEAS